MWIFSEKDVSLPNVISEKGDFILSNVLDKRFNQNVH